MVNEQYCLCSEEVIKLPKIALPETNKEGYKSKKVIFADIVIKKFMGGRRRHPNSAWTLKRLVESFLCFLLLFWRRINLIQHWYCGIDIRCLVSSLVYTNTRCFPFITVKKQIYLFEHWPNKFTI